MLHRTAGKRRLPTSQCWF